MEAKVVSNAKDKYEVALDKLNRLMQKRGVKIKKDFIFYNKSFSKIETKFQINNDSPEVAADRLVKQYKLADSANESEFFRKLTHKYCARLSMIEGFFGKNAALDASRHQGRIKGRTR